MEIKSIMDIYCCGCKRVISARLTDGTEIYPHRPDLSDLPFWKCDTCGGKVGCHHKTSDRTKPLGLIPTPEISAIRSHIHSVIDPIWKLGVEKRKTVYAGMSKLVGYKFHTANIRTVEDGNIAYRKAIELRKSYGL